jgi:hypothetical protein
MTQEIDWSRTVPSAVGAAGLIISLFNLWRARTVTRVQVLVQKRPDGSNQVTVINSGNRVCTVTEIWAVFEARGRVTSRKRTYWIGNDEEGQSIVVGGLRTFIFGPDHLGGTVPACFDVVLENNKRFTGVSGIARVLRGEFLRLVTQTLERRRPPMLKPEEHFVGLISRGGDSAQIFFRVDDIEIDKEEPWTVLLRGDSPYAASTMNPAKFNVYLIMAGCLPEFLYPVRQGPFLKLAWTEEAMDFLSGTASPEMLEDFSKLSRRQAVFVPVSEGVFRCQITEMLEEPTTPES